MLYGPLNHADSVRVAEVHNCLDGLAPNTWVNSLSTENRLEFSKDPLDQVGRIIFQEGITSRGSLDANECNHLRKTRQ